MLEQQPTTMSRFEQVARLIEGFESPFGLELLATVHWVIHREQATSTEEVVARTYAWDERKKRFSRKQILLGARVLSERGFGPTVA